VSRNFWGEKEKKKQQLDGVTPKRLLPARLKYRFIFLTTAVVVATLGIINDDAQSSDIFVVPRNRF